MSESKIEEIIAVLWFILAAVTTGWVSGAAIGLGITALVCAIFYTWVEYKEKKVE